MPLPENDLRPPSVPLVCHDPYFSIWSPADHLNGSSTVHWTGAEHRLTGDLLIDGRAFRFMGRATKGISTLKQVDLDVLPTRTISTFRGEGIELRLTFLTPALPDDLEVLSRPATYVTAEAQSLAGNLTNVSLRFTVSSEIAAGSPQNRVVAGSETIGKLVALNARAKEQPTLAHKGDWTRIDWGSLYVAAPASRKTKLAWTQLSGEAKTVDGIVSHAFESGKSSGSFWFLIAYDDEYSIEYFKQRLRPFWRRNGDEAPDLLRKAAAEKSAIEKRCATFDSELLADLANVGGQKYAELCALAYRQCWAANKLAADPNGQPLLFPKENSSNGCIATADVIYPMSPQFVLFGPTLTKAMLEPVMAYGSSDRWPFPFAPHDLGTYPQANGQVYGGGERSEDNQMPVEESANMLILVAALAHMEGHADYAARFWPVLTKWANYLKEKGFDPENQLCTDDFLGHQAHNVNLSAKAIIGLGCYARLCEMRSDEKGAKEFGRIAREFAARWQKESAEGSHTRVTFDKPGTWSQKYNLVWDRILGLGLFPESVARNEMAHYRRTLNRFGLPLDSRGTGAKTDWSMWTATLTQNPEDFAAILYPVYRFVHETPQRVPMSDWYNTETGHMNFFQARSVVGGFFLQMLYSKPLWSKLAKRDTFKLGTYAPIPKKPIVTTIHRAADMAATSWRYTTDRPSSDWTKANFDASGWKDGEGGFGTEGTPGAHIGTVWKTSDIWIRREFDLTGAQIKKLALWLHHDDAVNVFVNGVLVFSRLGWTTQYEAFELSATATKAFKPGTNLVAVHCHQDRGGQYIDLGFATITPTK